MEEQLMQKIKEIIDEMKLLLFDRLNKHKESEKSSDENNLPPPQVIEFA